MNLEFGSPLFYVECDIEVPENLREAFDKFLPSFKNLHGGRDEIASFMKEFEYAEKKVL